MIDEGAVQASRRPLSLPAAGAVRRGRPCFRWLCSCRPRRTLDGGRGYVALPRRCRRLLSTRTRARGAAFASTARSSTTSGEEASTSSPAGWTYYPWTGLQGFVPAALILHRAGYPGLVVADRAVLRTHEYLWSLRSETGEARWFDGDRGNEVVQLVNWRYGTSCPIVGVIGRSRRVGFTDWSHPALP